MPLRSGSETSSNTTSQGFIPQQAHAPRNCCFGFADDLHVIAFGDDLGLAAAQNGVIVDNDNANQGRLQERQVPGGSNGGIRRGSRAVTTVPWLEHRAQN